MKTTPCPQPPGEVFDNRPRVIVLVEDLEKLNAVVKAATQYCDNRISAHSGVLEIGAKNQIALNGP